MDLIGKAMLDRPLMKAGIMVTDSTPATTGANHDLVMVRSPFAEAEDIVAMEGGYGGRERITNPTFEDWEAIRSLFIHYYMRKDYPLRVVRSIMARHYGFEATPRMYKQRVKAWNLPKNWPRKCPKPNTRRSPCRSRPRAKDPRRSPSSPSIKSPIVPEGVDTVLSHNYPNPPTFEEDDDSSPQPFLFPRNLPSPDRLRRLEDILVHIDRYYLSCFHGQRKLFSHLPLDALGGRVVDLDDTFTDMGLLEIHNPGYAAISFAKSHQYREARIFLGEAQDKIKNLLRAQHPTLLPFILELICEESTTPEFDVSQWFRNYVCDLCEIIMGERHPLTMILQLLGKVDHKLETCAMILRKIQAILSAEFGASQWEARRPVKVFCRVLRHLGRYDEVEQILPQTVGVYGSLETPTQSELLGLLYELAWLSARGRHDNIAATEAFMKILRLTRTDAQIGQISHFRIKALRGLGILAREESRHEVSEQYFSAAWQESRTGFGRRDSNTVRVGSELEESLRELGRFGEADQLRRERDELFWGDEEAVEV